MQQYNNHAILHSGNNKDYLNAIMDSINHYVSNESEMKECINACNQFVSNKNKLSNRHYEPLLINTINYVALLTLETLGITTPTQEQIDSMEGLILCAAELKLFMRKKQMCFN